MPNGPSFPSITSRSPPACHLYAGHRRDRPTAMPGRRTAASTLFPFGRLSWPLELPKLVSTRRCNGMLRARADVHGAPELRDRCGRVTFREKAVAEAVVHVRCTFNSLVLQRRSASCSEPPDMKTMLANPGVGLHVARDATKCRSRRYRRRQSSGLFALPGASDRASEGPLLRSTRVPP
jgi:hypothetical protein